MNQQKMSDDSLFLPLDYQGEELEFEMKIQQGYDQKIEIMIGGIAVIFEKDNDERYRALVGMEQIDKSKSLSLGLLQAIAGQLQILFG